MFCKYIFFKTPKHQNVLKFFNIHIKEILWPHYLTKLVILQTKLKQYEFF